MLTRTTLGILLVACCAMQWRPDPFPVPVPASVCNMVVDAGPDTNVCAPGGTLQLMGSISPNPLFYQWTPATGLSNPFILNPTANITGPITYTLGAYGVDPNNPNLVVNGNFSSGNTGFSSDYTYVVDIPGNQSEMVPEGTYAIVPNPNSVHSGFSGCNDHTGGGGNMMVVNGAANLQDIWCQTVSVSPNSFYNVSAWVTSVNPASPAQLQFSINGTPIGPIINALPTPCTWIPFNATWNSGASTTAEICILNLNTAAGGNDFALDDISMVGLCYVEDEVTITLVDEDAPTPIIDGPTFLCVGETGVYTASFPPDPPIFSYNWTVPSGAQILSGQGTTEITVLWQDAQEGEVCLEVETRCDMDEGCFEVTVGTLPEFPLISGPSEICQGETATFYTPEFDPDDIFEWTVPTNVTIIGGQGTNELEIAWAQAGEAEICVEVTNVCGSIDNCTILQLYPTYLILFDTTICTGTTIEINGTVYGNGLVSGVESMTTVNGCDSIIEVDITEVTTLMYAQTFRLCPGDSVFVGGGYQYTDGVYTDSLISYAGCDSVVTTTVQVQPPDSTFIFLTTCDPTMTGITYVTYSLGKCDSTVITQVDLVPTDTTIISRSSCLPADTGLVTQVLTNQYGCDSLILTTTSLLASDTTLLFYTSCVPADTGTVQVLLTNQAGCDSLVISYTAFAASDTTLLSARSCFYADTGITSVLLTNSKGCDSLVILHTLYGGSDTTFFFQSSCFASDTGLAIIPLLNQYGCDSILSVYTAWLISDTTRLFSSSCNAQDTGVFSQTLINAAGCDSIIITTVTLEPINLCDLQSSSQLIQPLCFGDTALYTINITVGLAPFIIDWRHSSLMIAGSDAILTSPGSFTLDLVTPGTYYIEIRSANGLSSRDTITMDTIPPLVVTATTETDPFGYAISCHGDITGKASAILTSPGTPPYLFAWSTGSGAAQLTGLAAGMFDVTVTDSHGCLASDIVDLTEPEPLVFTLQPDDISCYGRHDGAVSVEDLQGGVSPWLTSLDQGIPGSPLVYTGLGPGQHQILITDQNGCGLSQDFTISEPEDWHVSLGPDTLIAFSTSVQIEAVFFGQPIDPVSVQWSDGQCQDCISRTITPLSNGIWNALVTDAHGCTSSDTLKIAVFIDRNIYIPNVFSPNGDGINDYFLITAASGVDEISDLQIFDRWGSLVYSAAHVVPGDPNTAWDGRTHGGDLNPGVFVYRLTVHYKDDKTETRSGDVTLIR